MLAECSNWWNNYIWDILLANIGEHIPAPWSIWVKITFKIHRNLKEAMKTRVKWWDGIEHGSIAMTTGYNGEIIVNMWGFTSKIWPILDIPLNCFTSSDPHPDTLFWPVWGIYTNSDILSGISGQHPQGTNHQAKPTGSRWGIGVPLVPWFSLTIQHIYPWRVFWPPSPRWSQHFSQKDPDSISQNPTKIGMVQMIIVFDKVFHKTSSLTWFFFQPLSRLRTLNPSFSDDFGL